MARHDLILRNPLHMLGKAGDELLPAGGLGAILARAGVGKTALMVQLALNGLLNGSRVLHVSLEDPIRKVRQWYLDVLRDIAAQYDYEEIKQLWDDLLPLRFVMTFTHETFSVPVLSERLDDLTEQRIFKPDIILLDGLPINNRSPAMLAEIRALAAHQGANCWLTVRTHRDEPTGPDGFPEAPAGLADNCDLALALEPIGGDIEVRIIKGDLPPGSQQRVYLDPATMLVQTMGVL